MIPLSSAAVGIRDAWVAYRLAGQDVPPVIKARMLLLTSLDRFLLQNAVSRGLAEAAIATS